MSGPPPFGFRRQDGDLIPDPAEVKVVVALAEAFVETGGRIKTAADRVNTAGLAARRGPWTFTSAARVLKGDTLADLLPEELYGRCKVLLQRRSREGGPTRLASHYLGNKLRCACRGRCRIRKSAGSAKVICRSCRSKTELRVVERALVEALNSVAVTTNRVGKASPETPDRNRLSAFWPRLHDDVRRQLVELLIEELVVSHDTIRVRFAPLGAENPRVNENSLPSSHYRADRDGRATSCPTHSPSPTKRCVNSETPRTDGSTLPTKTLRIRQVASMLNLPVTTVHDLIRRRVLEAVKIGSGRRRIVLIPESAVEALLDQHRVPVRERKGG